MISLKNKKLFIIFFTVLLLLFIFNSTNYGFFSSTPTLITKIEDAFESIQKWLLTLATPAAAVAIGVGLFMRKFSFGDEERVRTAKKLIRGTLFSYAFILAIDLVLSAVSSLIS